MANPKRTTESPDKSSHCKECGKKIKIDNVYGYCVAHRRMSAGYKAKHKLSTDTWTMANRKRVNEKERQRYAANPEKFINKTKSYYVKNGDSVRERRKLYHYKIYEDEAVRKQAQERTKKWASENPEKAKRNSKVARHKRRALEKNAVGSFTAADIKAIFKDQRGKCAYCRKRLGADYHADHVTPLSKGGTNNRDNIQLTCDKCNLMKAAKDPLDFARLLGRLL